MHRLGTTITLCVCTLGLLASPSAAWAELVEVERFHILEDRGEAKVLRTMQLTVIHPANSPASTLRKHRHAARAKGRTPLDVPRQELEQQLGLLDRLLGSKMKKAGLVDERSSASSATPLGALRRKAASRRSLQSTTIVVSDVIDASRPFDASILQRPRYVVRIFERDRESGLLPLAEKLQRHGKAIIAPVHRADVEIGSYWKDNDNPSRGLVEVKGNHALGEMLTRRAQRKGAPLNVAVQTSEGARQRLYRGLGFKRRGDFWDFEESIIINQNGLSTRKKAKTVMLSVFGHRTVIRNLQRAAARLTKKAAARLSEEDKVITGPKKGKRWRSNDPALLPAAWLGVQSSMHAREGKRARRKAKRAHPRPHIRHR